MRASQMIIPTLRDDPAEAEVASHRLLLRAGLIRRLASGMFTWLPLGLQVLRKVERIVRDEMARAGAQEILMPIIQPAELWKESGRWDVMGPELLRMTDRLNREYCVSPTHEEVVTDLFRRVVNSYRQLPCNVFHIGTKFRDEIRPRFGLLRAREFIMKDAYSFHLDEESFDQAYQSMYNAYARILERLDLRFRAVEADSGAIGDGFSHEFHVLAESGEDEIVYTEDGEYAANVERAAAPTAAPPIVGEVGPLREVATPGVRTIEEVCRFLALEVDRTVKTLVLRGADSLITMVLRGDHELNLAKAAKLPGVAQPVEFASPEEIRATLGCNPGSIGPKGLDLPLFIDRSAAEIEGFACGANKDGLHFTDVCWDRDVKRGPIVDLRRAQPGELAPNGKPLRLERGIEVGHVFQLGTKYTEALGMEIQNRDGKVVVPVMGCYGFGVSRMVAAIVEQCHDETGIRWPPAVAPAQVHILSLHRNQSTEVKASAERIYQDCINHGIEALLDDRDERPGVKFNDADLLGLPHRITVGERALGERTVEYKADRAAVKKIPVSEVLAHLRAA